MTIKNSFPLLSALEANSTSFSLEAQFFHLVLQYHFPIVVNKGSDYCRPPKALK